MSDDEATANNESRPAVGAPVQPSVRQHTPCDCLNLVNERLASKGYMLSVRDIVRFGAAAQPGEDLGTAPLLKTEKLSSKTKGRAPGVYGPFCMFCGQRRWPAA